MALLDSVKLSMGISHTKKDADITATIQAADDLKRAGVKVIEETDPLTAAAITIYCKWIYDYLGQADRWERAYNSLRDGLCLCTPYNTEGGTW